MDVRSHKQGKSSEETSGGAFGVSFDALKGLMKLRKREAIDNIQKLGGIDKLCQNLCSSPTNGISYIFIHENITSWSRIPESWVQIPPA